MWENSQSGGRGLTQTHSIFFSVFSNSGAYKMAKKTVKKCENSQTGGRGSATWEFFPHNPFLTTTLILIKRNVMVELFILGKDGHQVIWCNLVSIFVICADRIPGVLAILRSKGHQESGGVTKSVHR